MGTKHIDLWNMWKDFIIMLIIAMFLFQNGRKQRRNIDGGGISQRLSTGEYYPKTIVL